MFRDPPVNVGRAHLLFTTHDARSCSRRWPVNRPWSQIRCGSSLYPLADFKPRIEHNLARSYLGGRMAPCRSLMGSTYPVLLSQLTNGVQ